MDASNDDLELIWGAAAIARELNLSRRQTFYALETGAIPARKVAGKWVTSRKTLRAFFADVMAPAAD